MDAGDFWQQAHAPFGLHTAAVLHHHQSTQPLTQEHSVHQHQQQQQQQQQNQLHQQHQHQHHNQQQQQNIKNEQQQTSQLLHQQQHHTVIDHQQQHQQHQNQHSHGPHPPSPSISNHHLLFNAAAAAAAAAHLKSTALQTHSSINPDGSSSNNNNTNTIVNNNNNNHTLNQKQEVLSQQVDPLRQKPPPPLQQQHAVDQHTATFNSDLFTTVQTQQQQPHHQQHQQQQQQLSEHHTQSQGHDPPSSAAVQTQQQSQQQQLQIPLQPRPSSPLQIKSQTQHSPQPSTTPSGGSSTPDIKYNNDKLTNEIQLQLSRSSSAAAISERTLEECWSTLQRLFMHKSAMQQIQQQIPRVGLGPHGVGGPSSMGSGETKPHQCQQCMKSFSSNHQLVQHIRVHTGEKPYKCSYCDRRFKQLSHVQQHTRLHTGERPYKCHLPDCGRAFIQLSNLQQHLRNHDAQVERAKNRPFHCNICGKGFATESSLRTHTSKELQLHLGVLQQHAALIGGPNATSCPMCHKLFLGTEALMDHMKHVHKEKSSTPNAPPAFSDNVIVGGSVGIAANAPGNHGLSSGPESGCGLQSPSSAGGSTINDSFLAKRRSANHPCPVCGKHYVNEGSLRKHLASHTETSQLTNSLRMWPCSVCQAVFTHENGLLTHMDHMRMDPKHQFAAQYVLSRAAAERRERDSLLAATLAVSSAGGGAPGINEGSTMPLSGDGGSNSMCPSPSANSECSSNGRLSSSTTSDQGSGNNLFNNNNNNNNNTNNNNNCAANKLHDIRLPAQYGVDTDLHVANRMSLMAAASAAAAAVAASAGSRPQDAIDPTMDRSVVPDNAAVQAAVVNLAAAMRMNHHQVNPTNNSGSNISHTTQGNNLLLQQPQQQPCGNLSQPCSSRRSPPIQVPSMQSDTSAVVMNAMMRGPLDSALGSVHHHHHQHQHQIDHQPLSHQQQHSNTNIPTNTNQSSSYATQHSVLSVQQPHQALQSHPQHVHHHNTETTALRMQQQAEALLRSHTEAAFRLAASVVATNGANNIASIKSEANHPQSQTLGNDQHHQATQQQQPQPQQHHHHTNTSLSMSASTTNLQEQQPTPDLSEAIRLQEHRLEQALRLHNDARALNFLTSSAVNTTGTQQQPNQGQLEQTPNAS